MGLEYCRQLSAAGCNVLMVSNEREKLAELSAALSREYGTQVRSCYCDLAREVAAEELFGYCQKEGLKIDILVNNAGMFFFEEISEDNRARAEAMLKLHVDTPTRLIFLFGEEMKKRGEGLFTPRASLRKSFSKQPDMPALAIFRL